MIKRINDKLAILEKDQHIKILYAVESGSRAWGFESKDSDWDVRFLYIHRPEWYLSIDNKRDNMDFMYPDGLDLAGWELQKTLKLFRKSNPSLLEWLRSPMVYLEQYSTAEKLRRLTENYLNHKACLYHYLHMAEGNYREYLQGDMVNVKKYFYVLRPVLACKWIEQRRTAVPMEFEKLVETMVDDQELTIEISRLLKRKKNGEELDTEQKIPVINDFLDKEIEYFNNELKEFSSKRIPGTAKLNQLFRDTLKEVWGAGF